MFKCPPSFEVYLGRCKCVSQPAHAAHESLRCVWSFADRRQQILKTRQLSSVDPAIIEKVVSSEVGKSGGSCGGSAMQQQAFPELCVI